MSNQSLKAKIALPYAEALLNIGQNANILSEMSENLLSISNLLSESKDLQEFLSNPLITTSLKKDVLRNLFDNKLNRFILNFLFILVDRHRISFLSTIIDKYLELTNKLESIIIVELSSAVDLSEIQQNNLIDKIKLMTQSSKVRLLLSKKPELIGGFIVKIGSKVIDASLAGKLQKISLYLNSN
uniref:ATP synthase subunit delta, chloroplastic n=1 Tax=Ophidocladus simpliciusculus TaxID=1261574 RepID=A0A1Z1MJI8_9FLOR|nr:ATP synthase CF1 subunit delta [Ophidocladus simpliciusculus]ARW65985.1 ATP synthase CF1 subunit delta [Ophidocladus simpliciusculus]